MQYLHSWEVLDLARVSQVLKPGQPVTLDATRFAITPIARAVAAHLGYPVRTDAAGHHLVAEAIKPAQIDRANVAIKAPGTLQDAFPPQTARLAVLHRRIREANEQGRSFVNLPDKLAGPPEIAFLKRQGYQIVGYGFGRSFGIYWG